MHLLFICSLFFFNDTATTEIYTLSLHDALPICSRWGRSSGAGQECSAEWWWTDRKSTRLNSSHLVISYAVFCLKKIEKNLSQARAAQTSVRHGDLRSINVGA